MGHFGLDDYSLSGGSPMGRDRDDPMTLFDLILALGLAMDPLLSQLDRLLDDDGLLQRVKADLLRRAPPPRPAGGLPPRWKACCGCWG
jgi:hypothetical protein